MKRITKYALLLVMSGGLLTSCQKQLEKNPTHTIDGNQFFTKIEDYDLALTGAYQLLQQNSMYAGVNGGSVFLCAVDIAADNFYNGPDNLGSLNTMFRWNYAADNAVTEGGWDAAYRVIQQANLSVRGIDNFVSSDPLAVNRIEGQARALRAFMHFELLRWWCDSYDRNSTALGVAYVDKFDVEQKPSRGTVKTTYDKIEADLKTARMMLSNTDKPVQSATSTSGTARGYIDTLVVDAMLARMYLYANVPDSAIKYSSYVINARPLATAAEFPSIWQDASTKEVVWSIKFQNPAEALAREIYQPSGDKLSWRPVTALLNLYTGGDVRNSTYWTVRSGRTVLNKYFGKGASGDGIVDFKIFRTGEMYLIRAEAEAAKSLDVPALADLNALRAARNAATGAETGATLKDAIQTERRKELVVEGHRFFDLKRTTRMVNRTQNCTGYCTLPSTDRAWNLPIPQSELIANENMDKNPGY